MGVDAFLFLRNADGIFDLTENLRFAQDHGVQTAGDAEGVADGFIVIQGIEVRADFFGRQVVILCQPVDDFFGFTDAVKLGAVAGRKNDCFFRRLTAREVGYGIRQICSCKCQFFAYAQGRGLMIESDDGKLHGYGMTG